MNYLIVPSVRKGHGTGHLVRSFALARGLRADNPGSVIRIVIMAQPDDPGGAQSWSADLLKLSFPAETAELELLDSVPPGQTYTLVILDRRWTSREEYQYWAGFGPVVCIDEGGPASVLAAYSVYMLPSLTRASTSDGKPNIEAPGLLTLPQHRKGEFPHDTAAFGSVLVSFGGEDTAGLARQFMDTAVREGLFEPAALTLVSGAFGHKLPEYLEGVTVWGHVQNLRERLYQFDLVVTHFGITAYEALWAGCAVLLLNPTDLHCKLSAKVGFATIGCRQISGNQLRSWLEAPSRLRETCRNLVPAAKLSMPELVRNLVPKNSTACPVCGNAGRTALYRNARKSYFRCDACSCVYMAYFQFREDPYVKPDYFFSEYKAQYGRTYLEDLPALRRLAVNRIRRMATLLPAAKTAPLVLDVGCAYGAFVSEAQQQGWNAVGSDVSPAAVEYVQKTCGVPAIVADFAQAAADGMYPRNLDCLTMWYVIEHFEDLARVLRRVNALLRQGGLFCFSTPSLLGVSGRTRPAVFFEKSPDDHFTVWDRKQAVRILKLFGFTVRKIVITGHHPERFPGVPANPRSLRFRLALLASHWFGLGDTFECYAEKTGPSEV